MLEERPKNFTLYPLLWLAICFATGILTANFLFAGWHIYLSVCLISAVLTIIFLNQKFALIFLSIAFVSAGCLYFQIENQLVPSNRLKKLYDTQQIKSGDPIEIEGVLQGNPELAVGGFFIEMKTGSAIYKSSERAVSGKIRLFAPVFDERIAEEYAQFDLQNGSKIRVACVLRREDNFLNPGVLPQKEILDQSEIDAAGIIKSPLLIEKIEDAQTFSALSWLYDSRENLIVSFKNNFNISTAGVLIASLLGNKYFLDNQTAEVFREGGTFHVLVISGLHITFIGGLVLLFTRFFTRRKLWQFLITCAFLWSYAIAVGGGVPVVRAALMFTILLFSQVIYRQGTLLNSLGACAFFLLVWRPNDLFTTSFQLTFVSVASLVAIAFPLIEKLRAIGDWKLSAETPVPPNVPVWLKRFCETLYWRKTVWKIEVKRNVWTANLFKLPYINWSEQSTGQKILRYVFEAILVSFVVQVCLLPLMILYFHRISFAGILLNLWVGIIIGLESFTAIFAVLLAQVSNFLSFPFIKLTEFFNWILISIPHYLVSNSWASFRVPNYSGAMKAVYFIYFLPILALTFLLYKWRPLALGFQVSNFGFQILKLSAIILLVSTGLIVFHPLSAPKPDGRLHIDFLDVGQGDSALITFPGGETMLVDGGGRIDYRKHWIKRGDDEEPELFEPDTLTIGETVVSRFLWEKGYDKIDYILATHADADHIQGLADVAKNFRVRAGMFGRTPLKNEEFAVVYNILQLQSVPIIKLSRGDILSFEDVKVEVLSPANDDAPDAISDNNHSVVLRVIYGNRKFLLTGDIEKETETELLQSPEFLQTDVIKVAHHGSRTSSTQDFINATQAKLAVISVGRQSPFGHPHAEVVERWKNSGADILTTGERGSVSVSTDGKDLQLKTFQR